MENFKQEVTHQSLLNTPISLGSFSTQEIAFYQKQYSKYLFNKHIKKNRKVSHLIQKPIIKSLAKFTSSRNTLRSLRIRRSDKFESLIDAVISGKEGKNYILNQEDIFYIARIEYNNFISDTSYYSEFNIINSLLDFDEKIKNFRNFFEKKGRLTLIINIGPEYFTEKHWVVLIVCYEDNNYQGYGYYIDSRNNKLPDSYKESLNKENISLLTIYLDSPQEAKNNYNCGLLALENASNINKMLDENQDLYSIISVLSYKHTKDYFIKRRKILAEKISTDPIWQRFHDNKESRSPKRFKINKSEKIHFFLKHFIQSFISDFTENLAAYHIIAKGGSLTIQTVKDELKTGLIGGLLGATIAQNIIGTIPSVVTSARSLFTKYHSPSKEKAKKITKVFQDLVVQRNLPLVLSEVATNIFFSFESQFMQVTDKAGDLIAMEKLAEDAVHRSLNYIASKEINLDTCNLHKLIELGVLYGESEKFISQTLKSIKITTKGYLLQDKNGLPINSKNLYKKTGYVIITKLEPKMKKFYSNSFPRKLNDYGYRRPFNWEKDENDDLQQEYIKILVEDIPPEKETDFKLNSVQYEYILKEENTSDTARQILADIFEPPPQVYPRPEVKNKKSILFNLSESISNFSGRIEKIDELHRMLSQSEETIAILPDLSKLSFHESNFKRVDSANYDSFLSSNLAISGLGGIGKTQLALRYAKEYAQNYDHNIIWINAETKETLSQSFFKLASKLEISYINKFNQKKELEQIVEEIYDYFSDRKSLFILDNTEDYRAIQNYFPKLMQGNKPKILITSRFNNWKNIAQVLPLSVFSESEAEMFIHQELQIKNFRQDIKINELTKLLQCMPLALQQAIAYIKMRQESDPEFSINEYIDLYKIKSEELLNFSFSDFSNDPYLKTVFNTWLVTLDKIKDASIGQEVTDILNIMSYLYPEKISGKIFLFLGKVDSNYRRTDTSIIMHFLSSYSMISSSEGKYTIHRLVQQVLRINLEKNVYEFQRIVKLINSLPLFYDLGNEEFVMHYLHFLFYMLGHEEKLKEVFPDGIKKIIFSKFSFISEKYWFYFFDLAYIKYPRQIFLNFLGDMIVYNISSGSDAIVSTILSYLEFQVKSKILSESNIKYALEYISSIDEKGVSLYRYSRYFDKRERQERSIKYLNEFKKNIFRDNIKFKNCLSSPFKKRSICSLTETDKNLENIKEYHRENRRIYLHNVKKVSYFLNSGIMTTSILSEIAQGHWDEVAINFELITSSIISNKVADKILTQGISLEEDTLLLEEASELPRKKTFSILFEKNKLFYNKRLFFGKVMKTISPFIRRTNTIFFAYNLKNQIQAYQSGDQSVLPDIIFNGLIVAIDCVEAGIESMEFLNLLTGVSEFTGPITDGAAVLLWLGFDFYSSVEQVEEINKVVNMSIKEKFIQFLRAIVFLQPSEYLQIKANNEKYLAHSIQFLKENTQFKWYIFPLVESPSHLYKNNQIFLNETNIHPSEDKSLPDEPNEGYLFCLPGRREILNTLILDIYKKKYICINALGIEYPINRSSNITFIALGEGNDTAINLSDSPTLFIVNNGHKLYIGSDVGSIFNLQGDSISGLLQGGKSDNDVLFLNNYYPKETDYLLVDRENSVCGKRINHTEFFDVCSPDSLNIKYINQIYGRKNDSDKIILPENSQIVFVDGLGGKKTGYKDEIIISKNNHKKQRFILRDHSIFKVYLKKINDMIDYIIPKNETGHVQIEFLFSEPILLKHQFFYQYSLECIHSIKVDNNKIDISITTISNMQSFTDELNIEKFTISLLTENYPGFSIENLKNNTNSLGSFSYFFDGFELRILSSHQLYIKENLFDNNTIFKKINFFKKISKKLDMSISIQLIDNKTIFIGNKKNEIIYATGLIESHLVGSSGENIYVIELEKSVEFPIAKTIIYDFREKKDLLDQVDTLDLRSVVSTFKQLNPNTSFFWNLFESGDNLIISLNNAVSTQHFSIIKIYNAFSSNWYQKIIIYIDNNIPKIIVNMDDIWTLLSVPLIFKEEKLIVISNQDIDENCEINFLREIGNFIFYRDQNNLILMRNENRSTNYIDDYFAIICQGFYDLFEMRIKLLSATFKFFDQEVYLKDYQEQIDQATSFSNYLSEQNITHQNIDWGPKRQNYQKINFQQVQAKTVKIQTIEEPVNNENNRTKNWFTLTFSLIASGAAICLGYLTWSLKRKYCLPRKKNHVPDIRSSLALPLLNIPATQASSMSKNDSRHNKVENSTQCISSPISFEKENKENTFLKKASNDSNHLETLFMCDVIIRKFTGKKHNVINEFFSPKRENGKKFLSCLFKHNQAQQFYNEHWHENNGKNNYSEYDYGTVPKFFKNPGRC